ncbi:MAG: cyclic nucleotide-binding domain-containing protein [archaeon]|nr:cyclic nucleotide-binding domain-containing protein [archaeon]
MNIIGEGLFPIYCKRVTTLRNEINLIKEEESIIHGNKLPSISPPKSTERIEEENQLEESNEIKKTSKLKGFLQRTKTFNLAPVKKVHKGISKADPKCSNSFSNQMNFSPNNNRHISKYAAPSTKVTTKDTANFGTEQFMDDTSIKLINEVLKKESLVSYLKKQKFIKEHFDDLLNYLSENFVECTFPDKKIIYEIDSPSKFFYIIKKGTVELKNEDNTKKQKSAENKSAPFNNNENYFGEDIFIDDPISNETVICLGEVTVLALYIGKYHNYKKKIEDESFIKKYKFICDLPYFKSLNLTYKFILTDKCKEEIIEEGRTLRQSEALSPSLFLIKKGEVSLSEEETEIKRVKENNFFGLDSFIKARNKNFYITALKRTELIQIKKEVLIEIFGEDYFKYIIYLLLKNYISYRPITEKLFGNNADKIFKKSKIEILRKGETVILSEGNKEMEERKIYFVIESGDSEKEELIPGSIIGEELLYIRGRNIKRKEILSKDIISLEISMENIKEILKEESENDIYKKDNTIKSPLKIISIVGQLRQMEIFKNSPLKTIEDISLCLRPLKFTKGSKIIEEFDNKNQFYLISKGRVQVSKRGKILRFLDEGSCFGERESMPNHKGKRSATITAVSENVICYELTNYYFENIILKDENAKLFLENQIILQSDQLTLDELYFIKFLGKGKFGNVYLVHNHKNIYAIKTVSRLAVNKQKYLGKYFATEKKIMQRLDNPFIIKLVKTMKNMLYCFYLIEYIKGITFSDYMNQRFLKKKTFSKEEFKFYIANMSLPIEYLQKNSIANRDIKPNNTMLEESGYLKMIDFGTAKEIKNYTKTKIGTPHYMAPEILEGKGYSLKCDYWSLGVFAFELYYGKYPFGDKSKSVNQLYEQILYSELSFPKPKGEDDILVNNFISGLLNKRVKERTSSLNEIKESELYNNFPWEDMENKRMEPPFKMESEPKIDLEKYQQKFENHLHEDYSEKTNLTEKKDFELNISIRSVSMCGMDNNDNWEDDF